MLLLLLLRLLLLRNRKLISLWILLRLIRLRRWNRKWRVRLYWRCLRSALPFGNRKRRGRRGWRWLRSCYRHFRRSDRCVVIFSRAHFHLLRNDWEWM